MAGRKGERKKRGAKPASEPAEAELVDPSEGPQDDDAEPEEPAPEELEEVQVDDNLPVLGSEEAAESEREKGLGAERLPRVPGLVRHDALTAYVQETRRYPLLSREEEHELAVKYFETGDLELARRLVTANLRLVVKIAHEYRRAYRNLLDLIQEGNIGLMMAVRKYDPFRGVKLSSYAAWWIRAYMLKFILNNWRLVKIGTTQAQRKLFFNLRKEKEKLERLGFAPEHKLLAERLDVTEQEVKEMEGRLEMSEMSLDAPLTSEDGSTRSRLDMLPSSGETRPDVQAEAEEFRSLLRRKLEEFGGELTGRDQTLFRERWLNETPLTLQEIGDRFGISRERARQIEKRILDKLRPFLEKEFGSAVDIGATDGDE